MDDKHYGPESKTWFNISIITSSGHIKNEKQELNEVLAKIEH